MHKVDDTKANAEDEKQTSGVSRSLLLHVAETKIYLLRVAATVHFS